MSVQSKQPFGVHPCIWLMNKTPFPFRNSAAGMGSVRDSISKLHEMGVAHE